MSDIIQFPGADKPRQERGRKSKDLVVTQPAVTHNKLSLGRIDFTCPKCQSKTYIETGALLLRTVDFYCLGCGVLHRLTNPAFSGPSKTR